MVFRAIGRALFVAAIPFIATFQAIARVLAVLWAFILLLLRIVRWLLTFVTPPVWTRKYIILAVSLLVAIPPILAPSYTHRPPHYDALQQKCEGASPQIACANPHGEKIFISIILHDRGGSLVGGKWGERILSLVNILGPDNVFLSIYENDSGFDGRVALGDFKRNVPCKNDIVSVDHISLENFWNVTLPDGRKRVKRIAYLSELRNRSLRPLSEFIVEHGSIKYDKVLFLNDYAFEPIDAAHLLFNTNRGADGKASYLAACAVDWYTPFQISDIYGLRDAEGYASYQTTFPFFGKRGKAESRAAVLAESDAVRVKSCFGGMMATHAKYIQNLEKVIPSQAFREVNGHVIDPDKTRQPTTPLRFRHEPGAYYDASEGCLFTADLAQLARREQAVEKGIYLNPYVRVAYTDLLLRVLPTARRWERLFLFWHNVQSWITPATENPYRNVEEGQSFKEEIWDGQTWQVVDRLGRSGMFCGVRGMQVLRKGGARPEGKKLWVNTRFPPGQTQQFKSWWGKELGENWREKLIKTPKKKQEHFFEYGW